VSRWVADQVAAFRKLAGSAVTGWSGIEMALREEGPSGLPQFEDPAIPFLQLHLLYAEFGSAVLRVGTYQNDDNWGLCIDSVQAIPSDQPAEENGIYRKRNLAELPRGLVEGVDPILDASGDLVEVTLRLARGTVVLRAGEVYEEWDGGLRVVSPDESILVSVGPVSVPGGAA
jgi:hypothetical protein